MNKLRRNITNRRFTVEGMYDDFCQANCEDYCFMVSCTCDFNVPYQSETNYDTSHRQSDSTGYQPLYDSAYL